MAHDRRFRFAVTSHGGGTGDEWRETARRAEELGYATLFVSDHLGNQLAPVPALTTAAEVTTDLRLGTLVACNDFRHPVVGAMEVATLDVLSGGRVEWGLGAGWLPSDYERSGLTMDEGRVRVDRLEEAAPLMKRLFGSEPVHHDGVHYRVHDDDPGPRPVQQPHPPLIIGGAQRRVLTLAGREADVVGVAPSLMARSILGQPPQCSSVDAVDTQLEWVRRAAGARFDQLELTMTAFPTIVTDDRTGAATKLAESLGTSTEDALQAPHLWLGTVDEICADLQHRRDRWGVSYWVVVDRVMEQFAPVVERLSSR